MAEAREKIEQQEPALDVEFIQVLQDMIGDLTSVPEPIQIKLFSPDAGFAGRMGSESGGCDSQDSGRGRRSERNRQHHQRTGRGVSGESGGGGAGGIYARRSRNRCGRDLGGRTGSRAGGDQGPGLHGAGAVSGG